MLRNYIKLLNARTNLTFEQSQQAAKIIFEYDNPAQTAAFLSAIATKGETVDECLGFISTIKANMIEVETSFPVLDIVGTGGDYSNSINISTASALLTAACGVPVVKHGNRSSSSQCGSADVLEIMGFSLNSSSDEVTRQVKQTNFGFCFAPKFHPLLQKVSHVRKHIGTSTIFNIIGPLVNPANAQHLILGTNSPERVKLFAELLIKLKTKRSIVFNGYGLDELSCIGPIEALVIDEGEVSSLIIDPVALGLRQCTKEDLQGGNPIYNSAMLYKILSGIDTPASDTIVLNAAVAMYMYGYNSKLQDCVEVAKVRLKEGGILPVNKLHEIILRKQRPFKKRKSLKAAILSKSKAIIGEIKRASPSSGKIASIINPVDCALEYVKHGAIAISVLTDEGFEGSINDLAIVSEALKDTNIAILCKDFFIYPEQIAEAAKAGADAILIMVSVLHDKTKMMVKVAHDFGLETLVEVHNLAELEIALSSGGDIIGVNQRDLRDFSMHPELFTTIIDQIPPHIVKVAESGMRSSEDINAVLELGYNAVLVGTALSKATDLTEIFN
ncbi:MAG: anthranilate phosphoribosyltransferase [Burkholderiales bacterium]|nr:anthranilate phosphoribosyltransferase [Burkholderiales bacterium]